MTPGSAGLIEVPQLDAGVRVVRLLRNGFPVTDGPYWFPPAGPIAPIVLPGQCVDRVEVGIPGR